MDIISQRPTFMENKFVLNFEDPSIYHDRILVVGEKKFHVVAGTLSVWSEHFRGMFDGNFSEANKKEIELKDLKPEIFEKFLRLIYNSLSVVLRADDIIPLIEISYRFLSPMVLDICKTYINTNFDDLDGIKLQLLDVACIYENKGLKEKMVDHFKDANVISKFHCSDILEISDKYELEDVKKSMVMYMKNNISCESCSEYLDLCEKFNLPELKEKIKNEVSKWTWDTIPTNLIISLAKSAFKHDFQILKGKIRLNIFCLAKELNKRCCVRNENNRIVESVFSLNWFLKNNSDEIFALPAEVSQFIIMSTCNRLL